MMCLDITLSCTTMTEPCVSFQGGHVKANHANSGPEEDGTISRTAETKVHLHTVEGVCNLEAPGISASSGKSDNVTFTVPFNG